MRLWCETPPTGPAARMANRLQALIPVLETQRLTLRAPHIEDFDDFADMVQGERGHFYGRPQNREAAWSIFVQLTCTWILRGHGAWAVTDRETGEVLGFVQIGAEPGDRAPELGWLVSTDAEGRGIAHEAAQAARAYAQNDLHLSSVVSYIDADNIRSAALAKRLGACRDAAAEAELNHSCQVWRHPNMGAQ